LIVLAIDQVWPKGSMIRPGVSILGEFVRKHDHAAVDDQAAVHQPFPVLGYVAEQFPGPEGALVELDGGLSAPSGNG
jgi:hypothetical protein